MMNNLSLTWSDAPNCQKVPHGTKICGPEIPGQGRSGPEMTVDELMCLKSGHIPLLPYTKAVYIVVMCLKSGHSSGPLTQFIISTIHSALIWGGVRSIRPKAGIWVGCRGARRA